MEIENYPNYLIYEDGRVWSKNYNKTKKGKFLKCTDDGKGYKRSRLYNKNGSKCLFVHRLIAQAFIPNPENKPFVDHINQVRDDNRVENLRWATVSENTLNTDKVVPKTGFTYIYDDRIYYRIIMDNKRINKAYIKSKYSLEEVVFIRDMILND